MFTPMIAVLAVVLACMLSVIPSVAFYNEAKSVRPSVSLLVLYLALILVAVVIAVVPIMVVAEMAAPANGNYTVISWCEWGVGLFLTFAGFVTLCYVVAGVYQLTD